MAGITTIGREQVRQKLPEDMRHFADQPFTSRATNTLFTELANRYPDRYVDILSGLTTIAADALTDYGNETSIQPTDFVLPPKAAAYRQNLEKAVFSIAQKPISDKVKNQQIVDLVTKATKDMRVLLMEEAVKDRNSFALGILHGFRGSPAQLNQLLVGNMLSADQMDRPIPVPGLHGYVEGLTPMEYLVGSFGSRKGNIGVQESTAKVGFFGKQMSLMSSDVTVTGKDCGATDLGLPRDGDDPDIVGSVLARDIAGIPAGTVITEEHMARLSGKSPVVRSLLTCTQPDGVCQKCAGKRADGKYPELGSPLGVEAARLVSEPLIQTAIGSKHSGSTVGDEALQGFDVLNRFLQVPQNFKGGAALSPIDGKVTGVSKAPQGGHYISVGPEKIYVPAELSPSVKPGTDVEAGDVLSTGLPNPAEVAHYRGIGDGRAYVFSQFRKMLKENGVDTHARLLEPLARSFVRRVTITDPDGVAGFEPGETVLYSDLQSAYSPREGTEEKPVKSSIGRFLEKPVLHYSIGTRITPSVQKTLSDHGVSAVLVHRNPPGFTVDVSRMQDSLRKHPDWMVRLAGFDLTRGFLESATMGSESRKGSASTLPGLMNAERLPLLRRDVR